MDGSATIHTISSAERLLLVAAPVKSVAVALVDTVAVTLFGVAVVALFGAAAAAVLFRAAVTLVRAAASVALFDAAATGDTSVASTAALGGALVLALLPPLGAACFFFPLQWNRRDSLQRLHLHEVKVRCQCILPRPAVSRIAEIRHHHRQRLPKLMQVRRRACSLASVWLPCQPSEKYGGNEDTRIFSSRIRRGG